MSKHPRNSTPEAQERPVERLAERVPVPRDGPWDRSTAYLPVPVASLVPGKPLGFQIFFLIKGRPVLAHGRDAPFEESDRLRILSLHHPTVYVAPDESDRCQGYLEENLRAIIDDAQVPQKVKAQVVYTTTQDLVRRILLAPTDPLTVERSEKSAKVLVDYILRGRESFLNLFWSCSFDYQTYTHSVNVAIFSVSLARRVGYRQAALEEIGAAVLLHDIGKVRIAPEVLHRKGPLTGEEWTLVQQHPRWGLELVSARGPVKRTTREIILHHHEKLDGSGYPDGLTAAQIQQEVRLVTICDIFDAITSNRSYKKALSTFHCLEYMEKEMRGKLDFDLLVEFILLLRGEG